MNIDDNYAAGGERYAYVEGMWGSNNASDWDSERPRKKDVREIRVELLTPVLRVITAGAGYDR